MHQPLDQRCPAFRPVGRVELPSTRQDQPSYRGLPDGRFHHAVVSHKKGAGYSSSRRGPKLPDRCTILTGACRWLVIYLSVLGVGLETTSTLTCRLRGRVSRFG